MRMKAELKSGVFISLLPRPESDGFRVFTGHIG